MTHPTPTAYISAYRKAPDILLFRKSFSFTSPLSPEQCFKQLEAEKAKQMTKPQKEIVFYLKDQYEVVFQVRQHEVWVMGSLEQRTGNSTTIAGMAGISANSVFLPMLFFLLIGANAISVNDWNALQYSLCAIIPLEFMIVLLASKYLPSKRDKLISELAQLLKVEP